MLPLGFLLTQYTITGFDASAHISEETHGASTNAAQGVWTSIFYSAVIGWIVLLAITFAVDRTSTDADEAASAPARRSRSSKRLGTAWVQGRADHLARRPAVLRRRLPDQRLADVLRVLARPRLRQRVSATLSKVNAERVPLNAVMAMATAALIITLPALKGAPANDVPVRLLRGRLDLA